MSKIDEAVAENRRDVRTLNASLTVVPDRMDKILSFQRAEIEVTVALEGVDTRPLNDGLISGHPNGGTHGSGRGVSGDRRGAWSSEITAADTAVFTRDGRNAVRDGLAGQTDAGIADGAVGDNSTDADVDDTALGNETGRVSGYGYKDAGDTTIARHTYRFAETSPDPDLDPLEIGIFGETGTLLGRLTVSGIAKTAENELRTEVSFTVSAGGGGESALTTAGRTTVADAIKTGSASASLKELAWGTDGTAPTTSDTALGTEIIRKGADHDLADEQVTAFAPLFEFEPEPEQPVDFQEIGIFDGDGDLFWRVAFEPVAKTEDVLLRTFIPFHIR